MRSAVSHIRERWASEHRVQHRSTARRTTCRILALLCQNELEKITGSPVVGDVRPNPDGSVIGEGTHGGTCATVARAEYSTPCPMWLPTSLHMHLQAYPVILKLTTKPNVENRMWHAPATTSHARSPPSGMCTMSPSISLTSVHPSVAIVLVALGVSGSWPWSSSLLSCLLERSTSRSVDVLGEWEWACRWMSAGGLETRLVTRESVDCAVLGECAPGGAEVGGVRHRSRRLRWSGGENVVYGVKSRAKRSDWDGVEVGLKIKPRVGGGQAEEINLHSERLGLHLQGWQARYYQAPTSTEAAYEAEWGGCEQRTDRTWP